MVHLGRSTCHATSGPLSDCINPKGPNVRRAPFRSLFGSRAAGVTCVEPAVERIFFFTLVTGPRRSLNLKPSDTRVYEPQIRARLVERIWHTYDSQGQMLALAFKEKCLKPFKLSPLQPEAALPLSRSCGHLTSVPLGFRF